jgi:phosphoserine phosphatase
LLSSQENGNFTDKPRGVPAFQSGNVTRVVAWLESMSLNLGCFDQSWFYNDSHNGLPLMKQVSHLVAVDPDDILHATARERAWQILILRAAM